MLVNADIQARIRRTLIDKYGEEHAFRIERGVTQAAGLWTENAVGADISITPMLEATREALRVFD